VSPAPDKADRLALIFKFRFSVDIREKDGGSAAAREMNENRKTLGTLVATSAGDGLYALGVRRTIPLRIEAELQPETIERNPDGSIDFAVLRFRAYYDRKHWESETIGLPYTDRGIEAAINVFLARLGYTGTVGWSEYGRQEHGVMDFDADYRLIDEIWPDLPAPGCRAHPR
jgi:hypothetical protein